MLASDVVEGVVGRYAPDFELPSVDGSVHHLRHYLTRFRCVGVVFLANNCPLVLQWLDQLVHLQERFAPQGFQLVGINANDAARSPADRFEAMQSFATYHRLPFPYLRDETQEVAEAFGAICTLHAFLLNHQGVICYSGHIDLGYDLGHSTRNNQGLQGAIASLLHGHPPSPAVTNPVGTPIEWRSPHPYSFF